VTINSQAATLPWANKTPDCYLASLLFRQTVTFGWIDLSVDLNQTNDTCASIQNQPATPTDLYGLTNHYFGLFSF
jgi:hypothetical protein